VRAKKNTAELLDCATLDFEYVPLALDDCRFVVMNTQKKRQLADSKYNERRAECARALAILQAAKIPLHTAGKYTNTEDIPDLCALTPKQFDECKSIFTDETIQAIAACLYTAEWKLKKVQEQDIGRAQSYLDTYRSYCFSEKQFPFYTAESDGTFSLKDEWKTVKTESDFQKKVNGKKTLDEQAWKDYRQKNELLEKMLEGEQVGRYASVIRSVIYDNDYAYDVQGGGESATIAIVILDNNEFVIRKQNFKSVGVYGSEIHQNAVWNSTNDFSSETKTTSRLVYGTEEQEEDKEQNTVYIDVCEHMYGGCNNWYYGIWKGDVQDFTPEMLNKTTVVISENPTEADFDYEKRSKEYQEKAKETKSNTVEEIRYYFPSKNNIPLISVGGKKPREAQAIEIEAETNISFKEYEATGKAVLIGTVARIGKAEKGWDQKGNRISVPKAMTYTPYILENAIFISKK